MTGKTTPLYVVCSPFRCVGKTLISRLLIERRAIDGRPVAAFDLADEAPQLADYLPDVTTVAAIDDTGDQMAFFERLIADKSTATVVDLSHRTFKGFFTIAQKIGFFDEARRRGFEPLVLFVVDPDPRSAKAYGMLRRWFTQAPILPVYNQIAAPAKAGGGPPTLEIPVLGLSLRALVNRLEFSFLQLWQSPANGLPGALDDELLAWAEQVFAQVRNLEVSLRCEEPLDGPWRRTPRVRLVANGSGRRGRAAAKLRATRKRRPWRNARPMRPRKCSNSRRSSRSRASTTRRWTIRAAPSLPCFTRRPTGPVTTATKPGAKRRSFLASFWPPRIGSLRSRRTSITSRIAPFAPRRGCN